MAIVIVTTTTMSDDGNDDDAEHNGAADTVDSNHELRFSRGSSHHLQECHLEESAHDYDFVELCYALKVFTSTSLSNS